jgi:hypothetical protein
MTLFEKMSASLPGLTRQSSDNSQIREMGARPTPAHEV